MKSRCPKFLLKFKSIKAFVPIFQRCSECVYNGVRGRMGGRNTAAEVSTLYKPNDHGFRLSLLTFHLPTGFPSVERRPRNLQQGLTEFILKRAIQNLIYIYIYCIFNTTVVILCGGAAPSGSTQHCISHLSRPSVLLDSSVSLSPPTTTSLSLTEVLLCGSHRPTMRHNAQAVVLTTKWSYAFLYSLSPCCFKGKG